MKLLVNRKICYILIISLVSGVFVSPVSAGVWVDPTNFDVNLTEGCSLTETLIIGNNGIEDIDFILRSHETSRQILPATAGGSMATSQLSEDKMVLEYEFREPVVSKFAGYDLIRIQGLELYERTGFPIVPVHPVRLLIPFGKKVVSTRVIILATRELPGTYQLSPAQQPHPLSYQGTLKTTKPNPAIYNQPTSWPGLDHKQVTTQYKRGYQVFTVNLFPLQYVPSTGKVTYASRLKLEVKLVDCIVTNVPRPVKGTKAALSRMVDNPSTLGAYPDQDMSIQPLEGESSLPSGGPYQYVIITNSSLESSSGPWNFQALRDAKIAEGMTATIVTTSWIYANYSGTRPDGGSDNQTRIRNFLIDAYQTWNTEYVLLGGTNAIVPARMFYVDGTTMPVDMYYGCVDPQECSFDSDADGYYGEPTDGVGGGDVDLYAEIYVGRATVENATELNNFVKKTLTYNSTYDEYLSHILMVGEYLGFGGVAQYAKDAMEQIRLGGTYDGYTTTGFENHIQTDFYDFNTAVNLYDADGTWPKSDLINLMNQGGHVFNHLGHANYTYDMKLYTSDLSSLTNTDYFFAYSQGCMPGGFDTSNCFAEVITTIEHGAFAVIMNARYGWGRYNSTDGPSQRFDRQFWDAVLNEDMLEMGRANQDSKEDNLWDINGSRIRWCYYELNLFGDPAQPFRFKQEAPWIDFEPSDGTIGSSETNDISVTFDAIELLPGTYEGDILIVSNDVGSPAIVPVTMAVNADDLSVSPAEGFNAIGTEGGPFEPNIIVYTLTNIGIGPVDWTTNQVQNWLEVEPNQGTLEPNESIEVNVSISPVADSLDPNVYSETLIFTNSDSNSIKPRMFTLSVKPPDCFTESFDVNSATFNRLMLTFVPEDSTAYYNACRDRVDEFPTDPTGGTTVVLGDNDFAEIFLANDANILFYGQRYDHLYIGSNGYITFDGPDTENSATLENHFNQLRISGLFADLNPSVGGTISYKQLDDRMVVTFEDVPLSGDPTSENSFQIEMFFVDGTICITWFEVEQVVAVAGLSRGRGLPPVFFEESDLTAYIPCQPLGDFNRNYYVNFVDFSILAMHWLDSDCNIPYWCGGCDLDFSGTADNVDLKIFSDNWLAKDEWWLEPIAYWQFDEGTGDIAYDSVNYNHGIIQGAVWTDARIGNFALDFDGIDDYVETTILDNIHEPISISLWFKADQLDHNHTIFGRNRVDSFGYHYENLLKIGHIDNKILFGDRPGGGPDVFVSSTAPIVLGNWYYVVITRESAGNIKMYVNGRFDNSGSTSNVQNPDVSYRIGTINTGHYPFSGMIDDVRVYDRVLSAGEIEELCREGVGNEAFGPNPVGGQTGVDPNTVISWLSGKDAIWHDVYFGNNYDDVNDADIGSPEYQGRQNTNTWDPCGLEVANTYYWRIDEVTDSNIYKGNVWSFTTIDINLGVVAHWKFDEGTGDIAYDSVNNNDGTVIGNPYWVTGRIGGALDFDGNGDYVETTTLNNIHEPISISVWLRADQLNLNQTIFGRNRADSDGYHYENYLKISQLDKIVFGDRPGGGPDVFVSSTETIVLSNWYHVVITRESSSNIKMYINGIFDNSGSTSNVENTGINYRIGTINTGHFPFGGVIDDVRIYERVLSAREVEELYGQTFSNNKAYGPNPYDTKTGVDPNTLLSWFPGIEVADANGHDVYFGTDYDDVKDANTTVTLGVYQGRQDSNTWDPCGLELVTTYYWRIDEINEPNIYKGDVWRFTTWEIFDPNLDLMAHWKLDSNVNDSSGNGNDGTIYGNPNWVTGQIDGALDFDGVNDYVDIGDLDVIVGSEPFTITTWVCPELIGGSNRGILTKASGTNSYQTQFLIRINSEGKFQGLFSDGSTIGNAIYSNKIIPLDTWSFLVFNWDGTTGPDSMKLYINGALDKTGQSACSSIFNIDYPAHIGSYSNKGSSLNYFDGKIDDVRIYDCALTAGDVQQLYLKGLFP